MSAKKIQLPSRRNGRVSTGTFTEGVEDADEPGSLASLYSANLPLGCQILSLDKVQASSLHPPSKHLVTTFWHLATLLESG